MSQEFPPMFDTSVKLEETAKGVRLHIHVYGNGRAVTVDEAIEVYLYTVQECKENKIPLAPMESEKK